MIIFQLMNYYLYFLYLFILLYLLKRYFRLKYLNNIEVVIQVNVFLNQ